MIRKARPEDKIGVCNLIQMFFEEELKVRGYAFDYEKAVKDYDIYIQNDAIVAFVLDNDSIDGFIGGFVSEKVFLKGKTLSELMWYVKPEKRKYGLKLLKAFEAEAEKFGCDDIMMIGLEASKANDIYERLGYIKQESMYLKKV